jgi:hypothetical protein
VGGLTDAARIIHRPGAARVRERAARSGGLAVLEFNTLQERNVHMTRTRALAVVFVLAAACILEPRAVSGAGETGRAVVGAGTESATPSLSDETAAATQPQPAPQKPKPGAAAPAADAALQRERQEINEASALGTLRVIVSAQATYSSVCGGGFYSPSLGLLATRPTGEKANWGAFLIDQVVNDTISKNGYVIRMGSTSGAAAAAPASCNGLDAGKSTRGYYAMATPESEESGTRAFAVNTDGTIWVASQTKPIRVTDHGRPPGVSVVK